MEYMGVIIGLHNRTEASLGNNETSRRWNFWCEKNPVLAFTYRKFAYQARYTDGKDFQDNPGLGIAVYGLSHDPEAEPGAPEEDIVQPTVHTNVGKARLLVTREGMSVHLDESWRFICGG